MFPTFIFIFRIYARAAMRFYKDNYLDRASALAFTTLLALVPLVFVTMFMVTAFPIFQDLAQDSERYILQNFIPDSALAVEHYLQGFLLQATRLPKVSIIFLFITAILVINTIESTFNYIWHAEARAKNLRSLGLYLLFLIATPFIIGIGVFLSSYILSISWIEVASNKLGMSHLLLILTPLFLNTLLFSLLYSFAPNIPLRWQNSLLGAFNAALLCETARIGFTIYVTRFPTYALIYGAFAVIPIFIFWLYIFWMIVLFGALLTYEQYKLNHREAPEFANNAVGD